MPQATHYQAVVQSAVAAIQSYRLKKKNISINYLKVRFRETWNTVHVSIVCPAFNRIFYEFKSVVRIGCAL